MDITIKINTDNAAFEEHAGREVARILSVLADSLEDWPGETAFSLTLRDINGNIAGKIEAI